MSLDITITLSEEDLERFQESVDKGRAAVADKETALKIEEAAAKLIDTARENDLPPFISDRVLKLQILLNMIRDEEWQLSETERDSIRGALYYFAEPDDVIPDHIPALGFLDDAIYAEIVIKELKMEIKMYQEFCQFRIAEENRRRNRGQDPHVGREDWIADKRALLHSRMRERRKLRSGGRGWRMRLLG
ncbi:MAG: YkvA family protein [Gammaproteobacteria bacterium]